MDRLALAIGGLLGAGTMLSLAVDKRAADRLHRTQPTPVLLYQLIAEQAVQYVGLGVLAGLDYPGAEPEYTARVSLDRIFDVPVMNWDDARLPRVRQMLVVSEERFQSIVSRATSPDAVRLNAEEMGSAFATRTSETVYLEIHDTVLEDYAFTCPFTGRSFERAGRPHPDLDLVALWPLESGGPRSAGNFLPMSREAASAWRSGHITLTDALAFIVDKSRIDPEFEETLRAIGRLAPSHTGRSPDRAALAFHRARVFGR